MPDFSTYETQQMAEGAGARVKRAFPTRARDHLDPFVLLDEFYVGDSGFPEHPHEGFEIITYMLDGAFEHADSTGANETIGAGGAQRLRAGSGLRHSELPGTDGEDRGLQLWINLPREDKDVAPDYKDAERDELPTEERAGATVTTVVGDESPLDLQAEVRYEIIAADAGANYEWQVPKNWSGFLYVADGAVSLPEHSLSAGEYVARDARQRDVGEARTLDVQIEADARVAAVIGESLDEPIQQRGSVVL